MLPLLAVIAVVGGGSEGDTSRPVIFWGAGRHYWDGRSGRQMGAGYVDALVKSNKIMAATLFTEDLERSKEFYAGVFGLPVHWEDADSAVFMFGDTMVNLLRVSNAPALIAPAPVGGPGTGARMQFTIWADDVDAVCDELARRGVTLINGPMDRPWGIRTACFADPSGHIWEIAADLPKN